MTPYDMPQYLARIRISSGRSAQVGGRSYSSVYDLAAKCLCVLLCILSCCAAGGDTPRWFLLSRHGECAAIENLKRKVPEVNGTDTPSDFAKLMRAQGYGVIERVILESNGQAVQVDVAEKNLALIFVTASICDDFLVDDAKRSN